jgi:hypothetical protein
MLTILCLKEDPGRKSMSMFLHQSFRSATGQGEETTLERTKKCLYKWTTAVLAIALAVAMAPASKAAEDGASTAPAQPQPVSQPTTISQPAADTQQRLEELEREVTLLQSEIASLKEDSAPTMKTAAYAQPPSGAGIFTPSPAADDAPKISIASLLGPVTLSGFGDVYYGYDYNHPGDNLSGLRFFEAPTNSFNFNMAELILDKAPDATSADSRLGYHISAGYGYAAKTINSSDSAFTDHSNFFLKEAYLSYLAPVGKGLTITVGKFVTPMGVEVIESNANWNYTRSLLFDYAIPLFHFGANAKYAFNTKWALTGYLVNGWNNTIISHAAGVGTSSGLTYGGSLAFTPTAKWSVTENYFAGPVIDFYPTESTGLTVNDWKQISDTLIGYTPNTKWAFQVNGDYGFGPRSYTSGPCSTGTTGVTGDATVQPQATIVLCPSPTFTWWGAAGYAKYTLSPKTNFAARYEYYEDPNGYTGLLGGLPGHAQEVTGTYLYNLTSALLVRGEYRYDFAGLPIFATGSDSRLVKEQNTAYISFVYSFSSANAK